MTQVVVVFVVVLMVVVVLVYQVWGCRGGSVEYWNGDSGVVLVL